MGGAAAAVQGCLAGLLGTLQSAGLGTGLRQPAHVALSLQRPLDFDDFEVESEEWAAVAAEAGRLLRAADPELLVGISNANLYIQNAGTGGKLETRALPATFAVPVTLAYAAGSGACSVVFVFSCLLIRL